MRKAVLIAGIVIVGIAGWAIWQRLSFSKPMLTINVCRFQTDLARSPQEQAQGLAGIPSIAPNYGMLFEMTNAHPSFWMNGMLVPIDIIWISDTIVTGIEPSIPPDNGQTLYPSPTAVNWVLEIKAGRSAECEIIPGTKIEGLP